MNSKSLLSIQALIGDSIMSGCGLWRLETGGISTHFMMTGESGDKVSLKILNTENFVNQRPHCPQQSSKSRVEVLLRFCWSQSSL